MQKMSPMERLRTSAAMGLAMMLFVLGVRLIVPAEQDNAMITRFLSLASLTWFIWGARPDSFIERNLFSCGMVISGALLLHMMALTWFYQGSPVYFFVSLIIMTMFCAAAVSTLWIKSILASWTSGLMLVVLLGPETQVSWLGYFMIMYPFAGIIYLLATSLLKARMQLEQQQVWLEKAQSMSKMAGWEFDVKTGQFTWSPMAAGLLNIDDKSWKNPGEFVSEEDWSSLRDGVLRCAADGSDFEMVVQGTDGAKTPRWFSVKAGRVGDIDMYRVVGVFRDVTEAVAEQRELTRAKEAAETAVVARTRFLANMSHEIRTPMNGVIGMASLLLEGELGGKERSYAEIIRNSGESLLTIINQILDFSKYEAGNVTLEQGKFELEQLVTEALDIVDHPAEHKGLKLHLDMPLTSAGSYRGDSARLRQVLVNLLSNAVKFTKSGSVTLKVETENQGSLHNLRFEVIDTGIGITPAALPNLFDPFVQGDATTTRKFGGTGLGLAISREIVHAMDGEIDVYSHPKTGSKFLFNVPLKFVSEEPLPQLDSSETGEYQLVTKDEQLISIMGQHFRDVGVELICHEGPELVTDAVKTVLLDVAYVESKIAEDFAVNPDVNLILLGPLGQRSAYRRAKDNWLRVPVLPSRFFAALGLRDDVPDSEDVRDQLEQFNHLRVLLAEDNAINQKVAQQMLKKLGCVPDVAQNGRETVHMMTEKEYDLIFMDVQMPEVDGLEATRLIRINEDISQPYIVAMTANVMHEDRETCRTAGMDDFVAKPVRLGEVSKALRRASNQINTG
jgi:signal transduction histidine kinase/ActR/RegA family two-component response regulator